MHRQQLAAIGPGTPQQRRRTGVVGVGVREQDVSNPVQPSARAHRRPRCFRPAVEEQHVVDERCGLPADDALGRRGAAGRAVAERVRPAVGAARAQQDDLHHATGAGSTSGWSGGAKCVGASNAARREARRKVRSSGPPTTSTSRKVPSGPSQVEAERGREAEREEASEVGRERVAGHEVEPAGQTAGERPEPEVEQEPVRDAREGAVGRDQHHLPTAARRRQAPGPEADPRGTEHLEGQPGTDPAGEEG